MALRWVLRETLERHGVDVQTLARVSGIPVRTLREIQSGVAKRLRLGVVDGVLNSLERLTDQKFTLDDLISRTNEPAPMALEHEFRN